MSWIYNIRQELGPCVGLSGVTLRPLNVEEGNTTPIPHPSHSVAN